jgi:hypothetical protein
MSSMTRDLRERALRLRKEATVIRQVAKSLSFHEDRELFLQHAAALDAKAACLELQVSRDEARAQAHLEPSGDH